jgi:hypothetical protein
LTGLFTGRSDQPILNKMHDDGHSQGDMGKMGGSLQILDEILKEIGE